MKYKTIKSLVASLITVCILVSSFTFGYASNATAKEGSRLMDKEPSGWAQSTVEAAQDYSELFNLTWKNNYTDSITRGQFGILIDYVLYSKAYEYPEFNAYLEYTCKRVTGVTVNKFYTKLEKTRDAFEAGKSGAKGEMELLLDYELQFKSLATKMLSNKYKDIEWLEKYSKVLEESRVTHFNDTQITIAPYCEILYHAEIANGTSNTTFEPNLNITREQAAVMMYNLTQFVGLEAGVRDMQFTDDPEISSWAKPAIYRISVIESEELGGPIMAGIGDNKFGPKSNLTIEQALVMIYRLATIL